MKKILFALLLFFITGTSHAYTAKGYQSCGVYVEDYEEDGFGKVGNGAWLVGVLTGYNLATDSDIGKGVDIKSIVLHVYNYCKANPLKDTANAAEDLIRTLKKES